MAYDKPNIHAHVLLNLLNSLRKSDKMFASLAFYPFSPTNFINSIKHEHSCEILYSYEMHDLGKGLASWLSCLVSNCEFVTFPLVSWVRCGTWFYYIPITDTTLELSVFWPSDTESRINKLRFSESISLSFKTRLTSVTCFCGSSRGWGHTIGSPSTLRVSGDSMVWPYPLDVIQYARSSYYYDNVFVSIPYFLYLQSCWTDDKNRSYCNAESSETGSHLPRSSYPSQSTITSNAKR